jgi:hypothetical protein
MRSAALAGGRLLAALAALFVATATVLLPAPEGAFAAGLVAALLVILVVSALAAPSAAPTGARVSTGARAALDRLIPRPAQSDPDARGHARPRAPGVILPAV